MCSFNEFNNKTEVYQHLFIKHAQVKVCIIEQHIANRIQCALL